MKILIVRHGESTANTKGLISGANSDPLTDNGKQQLDKARTFLSRFSDFDNSTVFTTSTIRASDSAKALFPLNNVVIDDSFLEIDAGVYSNKTWGHFFSDNPELRGKKLNEISFSEGESYADLYLRTTSSFNLIQKCNSNIVFVIHGGAIGCLLHYLLGVPFELFPKFVIDNASMSLISKTNDSYIAEYINLTP